MFAETNCGRRGLPDMCIVSAVRTPRYYATTTGKPRSRNLDPRPNKQHEQISCKMLPLCFSPFDHESMLPGTSIICGYLQVLTLIIV